MHKLRKASMDSARRFIENERKMNEMYRKKNTRVLTVMPPGYKEPPHVKITNLAKQPMPSIRKSKKK